MFLPNHLKELAGLCANVKTCQHIIAMMLAVFFQLFCFLVLVTMSISWNVNDFNNVCLLINVSHYKLHIMSFGRTKCHSTFKLYGPLPCRLSLVFGFIFSEKMEPLLVCFVLYLNKLYLNTKVFGFILLEKCTKTYLYNEKSFPYTNLQNINV